MIRSANIRNSRLRLPRLLLWACSVVVIFSMAGCWDSGPPTGDLAGTVYFNDEVVGDCRVMLYDPTTKRWVGGKVDENGRFGITEIPVGNYEVAVGQRTTNAATEEPFDKRIPQKYRETKTSEFRVDISEGENSIELKMTN